MTNDWETNFKKATELEVKGKNRGENQEEELRSERSAVNWQGN